MTAGEVSRIKSVSVVIPVFNAASTIERLIDATLAALQPQYRVQVVAVDDGSTDLSHQRLMAARKRHPGNLTYVRLARNFGEHNAVLCGLRHATGEAVAIIDDDFQNPPEEILKLLARLSEGYDVVYSRYSRKHHSVWRNLGSRFNDWVATRLLRKPRGLYLSSFKVMNRFLVDAVTSYGGPYPYLDGLILRSTAAIGSELCEHSPRAEGRSNYNLRRLIHLWLNTFTSFSVVPLRLSIYLGLLMSFLGLALSVFFVVSWSLGGIFMRQQIPPGWASTVVMITLFAGIQLCILGVIGEYLGRVFITNSGHPQFVIRQVFDGDDGLDS